jgi:hypothetical protein
MARIQATGEMGVWCDLETAQGLIAVGISGRGDIVVESRAPEDTSLISESLFSPDGGSLLYATRDSRLHIATASGVLELPAIYSAQHTYPMRRGMQWSRDGSKVFVFGTPTGDSVCPSVPLFEEVGRQTCWLLFDATTGGLLWFPDEGIPEALGTSWSVLWNAFDATLSPDGEWIFMLIPTIFPGDAIVPQYGVVTSIVSGETFQIHDGTLDLVTWVPR